MGEPIVRNFDENKLETCIDTLRDVLNEMCCTLDEHEMSIEKLIVSRKLDKLIVEYMVLKKNKYPDEVEIVTQIPFIIK
ncbi:aspartyl-phosphate phosphatase Spo0E family protein [Clostridium estertheticum]|uniref:Spo0E family sporulation regulatory protein-aspartic acid phosphatase n=1 Tax=Clostridium estertheticum TaxID=238834 RepID=UPI0013E956D9|nr:Spo0E family sporulation regulatory protein-aspartic acid phosphatase [Clostridium estertheticum]MBZ9686538.1 aspartyl-phosphate phosphatase Spo0E family protein [Clostridium estertheticum]